jgi:NTP pyrophosphatase (non-canonical NTP hydrolase)
MNLIQYSDYAIKTKSLTGNINLDNLHMVLGLLTEVGELADNFKKELAYGKEVDWVNVKEELGDLMWYFANFCEQNGLSWEEILDLNVAKLKTRYKDEWTREEALNRDLEKERGILEKDLSDIDPDITTTF